MRYILPDIKARIFCWKQTNRVMYILPDIKLNELSKCTLEDLIADWRKATGLAGSWKDLEF